MEQGLPIAPERLIQRFADGATQALAVMGSFARGDAGAFSDLDILRFLVEHTPSQEAATHFIDGQLVVASSATTEQVEQWFTEPQLAVTVMLGLGDVQPLWDPTGVVADVQARARAFAWDAAMQARADVWASGQMVGWIEEAFKGLEGMRRQDHARLLLARHGLSWGLARVMLVQRGVLVATENAFLDALAAHLGPESEWMGLCHQVFGIEVGQHPPLHLQEQVQAGLRLYVLTAQMLAPFLRREDAPMIMQACDRIKTALEETSRAS